MCGQDFDKLDAILKDYKLFMSDCTSIDRSLPTHADLAGFSAEGLQIHVHVRSHCMCLPLSHRFSAKRQLPLAPERQISALFQRLLYAYDSKASLHLSTQTLRSGIPVVPFL